MENVQEEMVKEFEKERPLYEVSTIKIRNLIETILKDSEITKPSVTSRTKEIDKFKEKISREGKEYSKYTQVTDLSGVRITCFSIDGVNKVAELIKKNFNVITELSVDKRQMMDPDRFGYLSLHYVVKLSDDRAKLFEYSKCAHLLCEIQIRTLLQHTWAEIEHDLGYKSKISVPREIRRRFYRLAGILELADDEFNYIIKNINEYSKKVDQEIIISPEKVLIDKVSLTSYITKSELLQKIDKKIADRTYTKFRFGFGYNWSEKDLKIINFFKINTINELNNSIKENSELIVEFAHHWLNKPKKASEKEMWFSSGITIFYLGYLLVGLTKDPKKIKDYCKMLDIPYKDVYEKIIKIIQEMKNAKLI